MRQLFLGLVGIAAAVGLILAGASLGRLLVAPRPWILWIGAADEPGSAVVPRSPRSP
jgi:hypothetical protein